MAHGSSDITALIRASRGGNAGAFGELVEAVYPELHAIARRYLRRQWVGCTLQCTSLINEAYLRLAQAPRWEWNDRAHFFAVAAHVMRGILVDYVRARRTAKRGGGMLTVALSECHSVEPAQAVDVLDIHEALEELEKIDHGQSQVVELRYFGGFSIEEVAEITGVSPSTVKREWLVAKTWIRRRMLGQEHGS
jgi:RNA polymerase sigma factor (TIGR02999 family)